MTLSEYLDVNNMTKTEFSKLTGIHITELSRYISKKRKVSAKNLEKLNKLGIIVDWGMESKREKELSGFDYFRHGVRYALDSAKKSDTFHCWTTEQFEFVCGTLNRRKIAYYSYFKDCCWFVKYDKTEEFEQIVC